ncbi:hypothetical protein [Gordonia hirsuta]|nr:hypothetical protein [Gordonia hirsuta]
MSTTGDEAAGRRIAIRVALLLVVIGAWVWAVAASPRPASDPTAAASVSAAAGRLQLDAFSGRSVAEVLHIVGGVRGSNLDRPLETVGLVDLHNPDRPRDVVTSGLLVVVNALLDYTAGGSGYALDLGVVDRAVMHGYRAGIEARRTGRADWGLPGDIVLVEALGRDPARAPEQIPALLQTPR